MKIEHDGKTYDFDMDACTAHELRLIEQYADMSFTEWNTGLEKGRVDALVGLVFLAKRRAGEDVEWADLDTLNVPDLLAAMAEANGVDLGALVRGEVDLDALREKNQAEALQNREQRRAAQRAKSGGSSNGTVRKMPPRKAAATK